MHFHTSFATQKMTGRYVFNSHWIELFAVVKDTHWRTYFSQGACSNAVCWCETCAWRQLASCWMKSHSKLCTMKTKIKKGLFCVQNAGKRNSNPQILGRKCPKNKQFWLVRTGLSCAVVPFQVFLLGRALRCWPFLPTSMLAFCVSKWTQDCFIQKPQELDILSYLSPQQSVKFPDFVRKSWKP